MPGPVLIHSLADARAALAAAAALGVPVTLASAPGAAGYAGPAWFGEVIALNATNQRLLADCGSPDRPDPLYQELQGVFAGSEVSVTRSGRETRLVLPVSVVYADPFSMQFRVEATGSLDLLATARPDWPVHLIQDAGHLNCVVKPEFRTQLKAALERD